MPPPATVAGFAMGDVSSSRADHMGGGLVFTNRSGRRVAKLVCLAAGLLTVPLAGFGLVLGLSPLPPWLHILTLFAKLLIAALTLAFLFDRTIGRRLHRLEQQAKAPSVDRDAAPRSTARGRKTDELDQLAALITRTRTESLDARKQQSGRLSELARLNEKLSEINQEQSRFAYALSHDLKTPNNTIDMLLSELREYAEGRIEPADQEILDELDWVAGRLDRLIRDVMHYAQAVSIAHAEEVIDLETLIPDLIRESAAVVKPVGAEITTHDLPVVMGNPFQIRALFKHLISNALKFQAPGTTPRIEITGGGIRGEGLVDITVTDNGIGIAPEHQGQIFEMFTRLHSRDEYDGTGLGLTLCQQIVSAHGGRIALRSQKNEGCSFTVTLHGHTKAEGPKPFTLIEQGARVLRFGLNTTPDRHWTYAAERFATALREVSNGRFEAEVLALRRVAGAEEILQQVRSGVLDLAFIPAADIAEFIPDFGCLLIPFLADDVAHAGRILRSDLVHGLLDQLPDRLGVVGAGFGMGGMRQIICRNPVEDPSDLAGMKMRAPHCVPMVDFVRLITSEIVPLPLEHTYDAFVDGRIDATDIDAELTRNLKYHEHASVLLQTNHMIFPLVAVISEKIWTTLGVEECAMLRDLLRTHVESTLDTYAAEETGVLDQLRASGLEVRPMERDAFEEVTRHWMALWRQRSELIDPLLETAAETRAAGPGPEARRSA